MDLQHGLPPAVRGGGQALEAIRVVYNGKPYRIPTMIRDQTGSTTVAFSVSDASA
jgi:hypothetical protein